MDLKQSGIFLIASQLAWVQITASGYQTVLRRRTLTMKTLFTFCLVPLPTSSRSTLTQRSWKCLSKILNTCALQNLKEASLVLQNAKIQCGVTMETIFRTFWILSTRWRTGIVEWGIKFTLPGLKQIRRQVKDIIRIDTSFIISQRTTVVLRIAVRVATLKYPSVGKTRRWGFLAWIGAWSMEMVQGVTAWKNQNATPWKEKLET